MPTSALHQTPWCPTQAKLHDFRPATDAEIRKVIMNSKNTTCSLDPIPTPLLKECLDPLIPVITKLVNTSLSTGCVSTSFKHALVKPLLKKSTLDSNDFKNYRPISNLPFLSKVMEKIVASRLTAHMTENSLHENMQSAYKAKHSTETALVKVQNDILLELDKKRGVVLALLDLSAAFDTIDHDLLLKTLADRIGITGNALLWFKSYLTKRTQAVFIDGKTSNLVIIVFGVPQGSVLGPIIFTIYTIPLKDIITFFGLSYHLYADDTQLYMSFDIQDDKDIQSKILKVQLCVAEIKSWMTRNMLKLNDDKTEILFISSPYYHDQVSVDSVQIGNTAVAPTTSARNIGIIFDEHMSMNDQISHVCKSVHYQLRNLGAIRKFLSQDSCLKLVHAFISSRLDYGNALLYGIPDCQIRRLQRIMNSAARILSLKSKYDHIEPVLKSLHWLPVEQRIQFKVILLTFHAIHKNAPSYLNDLLMPYKPTRSLRSEDRNLLVVPRTNQKYGNRAFSVCGPQLWNGLPDSLRKVDCLASFKKQLKTLLFSKAYNT